MRNRKYQQKYEGVKKIIDLEFVCLLSCTIINFS